MAVTELVGGQLSAIEGKDGWLFLKSFAATDVMSFYTNENSPPEAAINRQADVMERRHAWFAGRGIPLVSLVAPTIAWSIPRPCPRACA
ncbi:hypothetical protein D3874_22895 [Oleomonas cavernae]|uniref:Uncharacterized protein n=1 Tax=Oleomonas cavernae TaxID=2320859 RepID=A0A418WHE9_9PROT|nr:hypothetical protein [Oleomonas cavernae]RJF89467.1 hypothetical protein D3874_22895 [Oleomonas cavernae]